MASTRSTTPTRAAQTTSAEPPKQALRALLGYGVRVQIAAGSAAAHTLTAWAHTANRFAEAVGGELLRRIDGETGSSELLAHVGTAGRTHARELMGLPRAAAVHFDAQLDRAPATTRRSR